MSETVFRYVNGSRLVGALLLAILLGACARPAEPRKAREVAVPDQWQWGVGSGESPDYELLSRWWEQFQDPVLTRLIEEAMLANPDIRTIRSRILEARARMNIERGNRLPTLSGNASAQTSHTENLRTSGSSSGERFAASLDASWEIDLFGRQSRLYQAAQADYLQARELYHASQASLAAEVAAAYINLRAAEIRLEVVEDNIQLRGETVQITQWREQAGEGSALESQQSLSTLEQARAGVPAIRQNIEQARNQIALLLGRTVGNLENLLTESEQLPIPPVALSVGIPADTLRQRPDVRAAERAVEAARLRTDVANRQRYPTLALSGSIGVEALQAGRIFNPDMLTSSLLGRLSAPIFDAGRIQQNIYIQSEQEQQSLIAYEYAVLSALAEVENALISVQRNGERLVILKRAIEAADEAAALASWQYEAGETDLLVVLEAQRTLLSLREQEVSTVTEQVLSYVQLYKSLGGGWETGEMDG